MIRLLLTADQANSIVATAVAAGPEAAKAIVESGLTGEDLQAIADGTAKIAGELGALHVEPVAPAAPEAAKTSA